MWLCCHSDRAAPYSAKSRTANNYTVKGGLLQRPPSCLLSCNQSSAWPSRKSLPGRKPAISSPLPPSAAHGVAEGMRSVEIHLLRSTPESASLGEQQHRVAVDAQRRCSYGALLQQHLPLRWWGVPWRFQSFLILPNGELHLISVRCHFHQFGVGLSAFLRRRRHLLHLCILVLSSPSPSSLPPRLLHLHPKVRLHPNRRLIALSTPPSLPSPSSVTLTLSLLFRGQMSKPLPHGVNGGRITYQSSVSSQVELRVSISGSHHTRGFEGALQREEAVSYGYAGTHDYPQPCGDVISPVPQTPPSPMSSPNRRSFTIPSLPSPHRPHTPPQTPSSPSTTNSAAHDVPSLSPPPFSSDMGSQSPLSHDFMDDNHFSLLLESPHKPHLPLLLSPVSSNSVDRYWYVQLPSPSTGSYGRSCPKSQGASADSESESFADSALVGGAVRSLNEKEEEEVSPTKPCPAARRLDMGSAVESQHSQSLPSSLSSSASSGAQSTSSAAASSFPMSTFSLTGVVAGERSSPVSNGLPAAGVSAATGVSEQLQCRTAVVWLTLPQLRDVVARVADANRSGGAGVKLRNVLLACHQDYPVVNGKSQVSYLVTWAGVAGDEGHARVTFEAPFCGDSAAVNPFFTSYLQQAMKASGRLEPNPAQLHLVDVLFDMARIHPSLAAILNYIPIMTHEQLELYTKEDIELIAGRHPRYIHYGRFGERNIGKGDTMQLHVALLKARVGSNSPDAPPPEPVVFFTTTTESNRHSPASMEIAHPILLPPPFIPNPLYTTAQRGGYPYEHRFCAASLASVTFHHLTSVSGDAHWHTATHNLSSTDSNVMTVLSTSKESLSAPPSSDPRIYRYLSNELNVLFSSSTHGPLRERNLMSAAINASTRLTLHLIIILCLSHPSPLVSVMMRFPVLLPSFAMMQIHVAHSHNVLPRANSTSVPC
jgi:hypothetical protein